jgi:3-oxoadipate enol-lactonase
MFTQTEDRLNLYYEVQGNSNASETLVFFNGLTQSTLSWFFVLPYFKANYKIVLLDFIFQGQSDKTGEWRDFDKHARDVVQVLNHEKITKATVVGISYGSLVAQHFAVNHNDRIDKLVLLSTFAHKTPYYEAIELSWWRALESGGYSLLLDIMLPSVLSENYFKSPIIPLEIMKASRKEVNDNVEAIFKLMKATKAREDYRLHLKKIKVPTLIIQGEKDLLLPVHLAQAVHDVIEGSKFYVVLHAGHTLNLENVDEVCKRVSNFLTANRQ